METAAAKAPWQNCSHCGKASQVQAALFVEEQVNTILWRFLCPREYEWAKLQNILHQRLTEQVGKKSAQSFYVFINNRLLMGEDSMSKIYETHHDKDGFLYLSYGEMEAFGAESFWFA